MLRGLASVALIIAPGAASAAPLTPTDKWTVEYTATSCTARRPYRDTQLAIEPAPLGHTTRLTVSAAAKPVLARQTSTEIELADGGKPIQTTSLYYPLLGRSELRTNLPNHEAARLFASPRLKIISKLPVSQPTRRTRMSRAGIGAPRLSFDFELQAMPAVSRALEKCLADLRAEWGMVDGKLPEPAEQPRPLVPLGALFKPDDYPYDAIVANQSGQVRLMVMIDERGTVLDCVALETSGIASVDAISCNIVVGRARFKPALAADGKPVKSTYLAVIDWRIVDR